MRIALIGFGKMGKAIEEVAFQRNHEIVLRIGMENLEDFTLANLQKADVAIEFTGPHSAYENITKCLQSGVNVVSGSTGWLSMLEEARQSAIEADAGFLYASNFSLGVNLFFALNQYLAKLIAPFSGYEVSLTEIHHTAKLDAPSGTAITLAEQILPFRSDKTGITLKETEKKDHLYIESKRIDPAPGTHVVRYESEIDTICIEHEAHNRKGFAIGAVLAAEYLHGKKGIFTMNDVLGL
jgi:4-hydroxy-tetrahydrodipicolinate reductase